MKIEVLPNSITYAINEIVIRGVEFFNNRFFRIFPEYCYSGSLANNMALGDKTQKALIDVNLYLLKEICEDTKNIKLSNPTVEVSKLNEVRFFLELNTDKRSARLNKSARQIVANRYRELFEELFDDIIGKLATKDVKREWIENYFQFLGTNNCLINQSAELAASHLDSIQDKDLQQFLIDMHPFEYYNQTRRCHDVIDKLSMEFDRKEFEKFTFLFHPTGHTSLNYKSKDLDGIRFVDRDGSLEKYFWECFWKTKY